MKVLVIGSGAREHALAWKIALSDKVSQVFVAPGNVGTSFEKKIKNINLTSHEELINFCKQNNIDFTIVGPEIPLSLGIVNDFQKENLKIFGPNKFASQLESSKIFAKEFMLKNNIPTANYRVFDNAILAYEYIEKHKFPIVIKADGLAAGKGVIIAHTKKQAYEAVDRILNNNVFKFKKPRIIIEDFLQGKEASFIVMVDGKNILPMATSQDHKRLKDNDVGLNTGGMGAYSPALFVNSEIYNKTIEKIILPVVNAMQKLNNPYIGFLYAGIMIDSDNNPYVIEFNCRFGDPEAQPIMYRLETDLVDLILSALGGKLDQQEVKWNSNYSIAVVLATENYPNNPITGDVIEGIDEAQRIAKVFYAGISQNDKLNLVTSGGRVLSVVAQGKDIKIARQKVYKAVSKINFRGMQYRKDIGNKALKI